MIEGLSSSLKRVVSVGMYAGFKVVWEGLEASHLKYANDTINVEDLSLNNTLTIKANLEFFSLFLTLILTSIRVVS